VLIHAPQVFGSLMLSMVDMNTTNPPSSIAIGSYFAPH
jgi:hypothetical protein